MVLVYLLGVRNTPTGVGKTLIGSWSFPLTEKHPHGRGEDEHQALHKRKLGETPPRAWGRRVEKMQGGGNEGNTPTGVGKTTLRLRWKSGRWKHPHGRGEDVASKRAFISGLETPPRAWGRQQKTYWAPPNRGNTPTGVGKTLVKSAEVDKHEKHPHGRGEDKLNRFRNLNLSETPPRAWGRREADTPDYAFIGNTPTGVGKTRPSRMEIVRIGKHPHGRGEDTNILLKIAPSQLQIVVGLLVE